MKVKVSFTVDVNLEEWREHQGDMSEQEVREDVRTATRHQAECYIEDMCSGGVDP